MALHSAPHGSRCRGGGDVQGLPQSPEVTFLVTLCTSNGNGLLSAEASNIGEGEGCQPFLLFRPCGT